MDWEQSQTKEILSDSIIDTVKSSNSPNSLCENHSPSTSFVAEGADESDEKLSLQFNDANDNDSAINNDVSDFIEEHTKSNTDLEFDTINYETDANVTEVDAFVNSLKQFFNSVASTTYDNSTVTPTISASIVSKDFQTSTPSTTITTTTTTATTTATTITSATATSTTKRRRPRRNPVWQYFRVENNLAVCKHCNYSTKSVFSTNLKVHLRSHHRRLFDSVAEAEKAMEISAKNAANAMKVLKACSSSTTVAPLSLNSPSLSLSNYLFNGSSTQDSNQFQAQLQSALNHQKDDTEMKRRNIDSLLSNNNYLKTEENMEFKTEANTDVVDANNVSYNAVLAALCANSSNSNSEQFAAISNFLSNPAALLANCQNLLSSTHQPQQDLEQINSADVLNSVLMRQQQQEGSLLCDNGINTSINGTNNGNTTVEDSLETRTISIDESDIRAQINQILRSAKFDENALNILNSASNGNLSGLFAKSSNDLLKSSMINEDTRSEDNLLNTTNVLINGNLPTERSKQRRKRLRRHPVWNFFKDVEDKIVGCVMCNFRTTSAFSTNLKMHLKAHHKEQFIQVLQTEQDQLGNMPAENDGEFEVEKNQFISSSAQLCSRNGRVKRRRKTAEEIQAIIDKCKNNLAKERQKRVNMNLSSILPLNSMSAIPVDNLNFNYNKEATSLSNLWKALQFHNKTVQENIETKNGSTLVSIDNENGLDSLLESSESKNFKTEMSASEKLNAMIGMICHNNNNNLKNDNCQNNGLLKNSNEICLFNNNNKYEKNFLLNNDNNNIENGNQKNLQQKLVTATTTTTTTTTTTEENMESEQIDNQKLSNFNLNTIAQTDLLDHSGFKSSTVSPNSDFSMSSVEIDEIQKFFAIANASENKVMRSIVINKVLDLALAKIVECLGSSLILRLPAFKLIMSMLAPDYDFSTFELSETINKFSPRSTTEEAI